MACGGSNGEPVQFKMRVGDTGPTVRFRLYGKSTGEALDLTNVTLVTFKAKHRRKSVGISGGCTIVQSGTSDIGVVTYNWQAGDTDVSGVYCYWFEIQWANGEAWTVPPRDDSLLFEICEEP